MKEGLLSILDISRYKANHAGRQAIFHREHNLLNPLLGDQNKSLSEFERFRKNVGKSRLKLEKLTRNITRILRDMLLQIHLKRGLRQLFRP